MKESVFDILLRNVQNTFFCVKVKNRRFMPIIFNVEIYALKYAFFRPL